MVASDDVDAVVVAAAYDDVNKVVAVVVAADVVAVAYDDVDDAISLKNLP